MNNDEKGDELKKFVTNSGSLNLNLSEVDDVSALYNYFNSVLGESKPVASADALVSGAGVVDDSSSSLQGDGAVSDCFYHIRKHGSQLGVRLYLPALNRVLCSDRVSQMTKTYNDVEAVTRLLEENDRGSMERTSNVLNRLSRKSSESNDVQLAWSSTESHPEWFQISGHPDCFAVASPSTVWKKCSDSVEGEVYEALSKEPTLQGVIPRYFRTIEHDGQTFIEMQDLLHGFEDPQVMDIKLGVRTFLESEVSNSSERQDLYRKMISIDPSAPTEEEHKLQAVTKLRYMQFREDQSSSCSQGFRIEAIKLSGEPPRTNLQRVKTLEDVQETLKLFLKEKEGVRSQLVIILRKIRNKLEEAQYLKNHEVVGSSILIIHDNTRVGAWLIDFSKTRPLPANKTVNHRAPWIPGNHEEGLLFGLDNVIKILENLKLDKRILKDCT